MKYWLTTHWPRLECDPDTATSGIYIMDGKLDAAEGMQRDDLVLIYQTGSGLGIVRRYADGTTSTIRHRKGRQGIIALARIDDSPSHQEDSHPESYADGSERWWRYYAPTMAINTAGFVGREEVARVLGYSEKYNFRGFGKSKSGLKELSSEEFDQLRSMFLEPVRDHDTTVRHHIRRRGGAGIGEGPVHRALKEAISNDPASLLDEPGLRCWEVEYILPTNDRIDVVLKDEYERFVVVEVEVDCDETELVGPLQCMKYRALIAYLYGRELQEVRTVLVAHTIDNAICRQCEKYGIESRIVTRGT